MAHEFHHPNWYKRQAASRKRQATSIKPEDLHAVNTESFKHQAPKSGDELRSQAYAKFAFRFMGLGPKLQAKRSPGTKRKPQAPSPGSKRQAPSRKRQAP